MKKKKSLSEIQKLQDDRLQKQISLQASKFTSKVFSLNNETRNVEFNVTEDLDEVETIAVVHTAVLETVESVVLSLEDGKITISDFLTVIPKIDMLKRGVEKSPLLMSALKTANNSQMKEATLVAFQAFDIENNELEYDIESLSLGVLAMLRMLSRSK